RGLHPAASLAEHVSDVVAQQLHVWIGDADRHVAVRRRLVAYRLIEIQRQHLPSDAGIAAAQQADVVDLLDQHDQAIKANAHGQAGPLLTWQMTLVPKPRVDLPAFEDLDPPLA